MQYIKRFVIYFIGMLLLAMGIILNTKTAWGVSPIISVAYCFSTLVPIAFSNAVMLLYVLQFIAQEILKKRLTWIDFLQVPFAYLFTRCMNLFTALLPSPEALGLRIFMLVMAVLCTGFGIALMVACHLVPNPADGLVGEISRCSGKSMGLTKNIFDGASVCITLCMGLIGAGQIIGIGVGTVCAIIGTGRAVALCNYLFLAKVQPVIAAAPIPAIGE